MMMRLRPGAVALRLEFIMDHQFVDYQTLPFLKLDSSNFDLNSDFVDIDLRTQDIFMKIYGEFVRAFKAQIVWTTQTSLNLVFNPLFNTEIAAIQSDFDFQKRFSSFVIETFFNVLPVIGQQIQIPSDTFITYAMCDERRAAIEEGRINAYFPGDVRNMEESHRIKEEKYTRWGDLNLDPNGAPFQFYVSTRVINNVFELIMGYNQLEMRIPQEYFKIADFPIPFTTTQIDGAVPGLADYAGYDIPMSAVFKNKGAPRYIFNQEEMSVLFSMDVDYYLEDFSEKLMTITYNDIYIDYDMWLEGMKMKVDWWSIRMGSAHVQSDVIENLEVTNADQHVEDYFNWAFEFILAWVDDNEIENVSFFPIPDEIPGVMRISHLEMGVEENFFKFSSEIQFTVEDIGSTTATNTFENSAQEHYAFTHGVQSKPLSFLSDVFSIF